MKKFWSLLLALVMALSMAGVSAVAEGNTVLKVAVFEGGYGADYWLEVAKLFEAANPGVTVEVTHNPEIGDIVRPQILAGDAPDFIYLASANKSGLAQALIKDMALEELTDVFTDELKAKILPGFLETQLCQPYGDGKIYLAPMFYSPTGLWYNKNYFETNKIEAPVTWDDFFALKNAITDRSVFTYQGSHPGYLEALIVPAIASAAGAEVMNGCFNYDVDAWKNEAVVATLENIARIGTEGLLLPGTPAMQFSEAQSEFVLGKAALCTNGTWFEGEMAEAPKEEGFEWGFCAAPAMSAEGDKYVFTTLEEMYIPASAKNIDLAKKFLAFQYSDEAVKLCAEKAKGIPPVAGAAEVLKPEVSSATYEALAIYDKGYKPYIGGFTVVEDTSVLPKDEFFGKAGAAMSGELSGADWANLMVAMSEELVNKIVK